MDIKVWIGIFIPLAGTTLGAAMVYLVKNIEERLNKVLTGFAAGVMVAASFWSLLQPALEMSSKYEKLAFIPSAFGFMLGILFLLFLDQVTPHMHLDSTAEGPKSNLSRTMKMVLAVTLHNIPEGMAVGVVYAGWLSGSTEITYMGALALALGIAIQNFPEGAIVSMPLEAEGMNKHKTFLLGFLSGVVEPVGALLTIAFSSVIIPLLPYFLAFAAGAMMYVVVEELIPEMSQGKHSNLPTLSFSIGFVIMMILDVALG